ncbi:spondin domain-containing protein [Denitrobaculum tricleocarpae]|uniref:PEP-CTERM sorting domain-containing protein n=1 Tax=Denitrobaculum tricleocarpae TaxID=2591009 RepID=A0A545U177_9PROT|nr:spondin domain-containing protein [Denitrobaculum tricleocarpae]TQV83198.1 PEP-CTERM sorting domain-containing protein [Denitrobaculum tricleocarpae]
MLKGIKTAALAVALGTAAFASGGAKDVEAKRLLITFENLAQNGGFFFTPVYGAFHDNSGFDIFNVGEAASPVFERLAEDGTFTQLRDDRVANFPDSQGFALNAGVGPIGPQSSVSFEIDVDGNINTHFVFATMLIPSQDAFIGLDDSVELFDSNGSFISPFSLTFDRTDIYDAGTEDNADNSAVAFLNQAAPDTGVSENGVIGLHEGLSAEILDAGFVGPNGDIPFSRDAADFLRDDFGPFARLTVTAVDVPEPSTIAMFGFGLLGFAALRHRRQRKAA